MIREFEIKTRSSYSAKTGQGYWSAAIREPNNPIFRRIAISGSIPKTDSETMELIAAIQALKKIPYDPQVLQKNKNYIDFHTYSESLYKAIRL